MAFKVGSTTVVDDSAKVVAAQLILMVPQPKHYCWRRRVLVFDAMLAIRKATITSALVGYQGYAISDGADGAQTHTGTRLWAIKTKWRDSKMAGTAGIRYKLNAGAVGSYVHGAWYNQFWAMATLVLLQAAAA